MPSTSVALNVQRVPHPTFADEAWAADLRNPGTIPLNFTKSINLAVSERGINAMRLAGHPTLLETVMDGTIPMRGRMVHGRGPTGALYEHSQDYDAKGRVGDLSAISLIPQGPPAVDHCVGS